MAVTQGILKKFGTMNSAQKSKKHYFSYLRENRDARRKLENQFSTRAGKYFFSSMSVQWNKAKQIEIFCLNFVRLNTHKKKM